MSLMENVLTTAKMWMPDVRIVHPQPARLSEDFTAIFVKAGNFNNSTLRSGSAGFTETTLGNLILLYFQASPMFVNTRSFIVGS